MHMFNFLKDVIVERLSFFYGLIMCAAALYPRKKRDYVKATYKIYICDYMILGSVRVIASSAWDHV